MSSWTCACNFKHWHVNCSPTETPASRERSPTMFKFLASTIGVIFLIGLIVIVLLLMLIF